MKLKIGVFFGGSSVEHEVSIISAIQAINNIDKDKYEKNIKVLQKHIIFVIM